MNKKQMVVLWIGGVLTAVAFFAQVPFTGIGITIISFLFIYTFKPKGDSGNSVKQLAIGAFIFLSLATMIGISANTAHTCSGAEQSCSDATSACEQRYR